MLYIPIYLGSSLVLFVAVGTTTWLFVSMCHVSCGMNMSVICDCDFVFCVLRLDTAKNTRKYRAVPTPPLDPCAKKQHTHTHVCVGNVFLDK